MPNLNNEIHDNLSSLKDLLDNSGFESEAQALDLIIQKWAGQIPAGMMAFQLRTGLFGGSDYDSPFDVIKPKTKPKKKKKTKSKK